jgi:hypothetical protein
VESDQRAQDCLLPMGITSENVAECYGISHKQQDVAAVCSKHPSLYSFSICFVKQLLRDCCYVITGQIIMAYFIIQSSKKC